MAMATGCKPVVPLGHGVFDSLTLNHFLYYEQAQARWSGAGRAQFSRRGPLDCRRADCKVSVAMSFNGRKAASEAVNRGSSPRAATKFWTATSMADYAPFKRWNEGSTPSRSTNFVASAQAPSGNNLDDAALVSPMSFSG
jgi:hypothetical protein